MAENGRLPDSALAPIAGGGRLADDAAAAWNALAQKVYRETGHRLSASEAYRTYARQVYFWNLYTSGQGNLAARPGTSNHGWAKAVDLDDYTDREMVDRFGAPFGWSKSWSDAPSEWWHILYQPGHYTGPNPGPDYDPKPSWWKKVGHKIAAARKRRLSKKQKRKDSRIPSRREQLHRQIQKLGRLIERLIDRRKKAS